MSKPVDYVQIKYYEYRTLNGQMVRVPIAEKIEIDFSSCNLYPPEDEQINCECGAESCGYNSHSHWCPKHVD